MVHTTVCKLQVRFSQALYYNAHENIFEKAISRIIIYFLSPCPLSKESYIRQELILSTIILVKLKKKEQTKHNLLNDYFIKY